METEEERRARLENDATTKRSWRRTKKESKTEEDGSIWTGHVGHDKRCDLCGCGFVP